MHLLTIFTKSLHQLSTHPSLKYLFMLNLQVSSTEKILTKHEREIIFTSENGLWLPCTPHSSSAERGGGEFCCRVQMPSATLAVGSDGDCLMR